MGEGGGGVGGEILSREIKNVNNGLKPEKETNKILVTSLTMDTVSGFKASVVRVLLHLQILTNRGSLPRPLPPL